MIQSEPEMDLLTAESTPDWERIEFDVLCSRCDYNLRTLIWPKCPECGLDFAWHDMLHESGFKSDFLFEHHWKRRPIKSFVQTFLRCVQPRRFWQRISIHSELSRTGLNFLLFSSSLIFTVVLYGTARAFFFIFLRLRLYAPFSLGGFNLYRSQLWNLARAFERVSNPAQVSIGVLSFVATVLATMLLLLTLRQTLGRCKVKRLQIKRVLTYAILPMSLIAPLVLLCFSVIPSYLIINLDLASLSKLSGIIIVWFLLSYYVSAGLKYYLRLPRPRALACTAVFVGMLFALTSVVIVLVEKWGGF